jgi:hypothetical protein
VSRPATGRRPARWYVLVARVTPVLATTAAAAIRTIETRNPRRGAQIGRAVAVRTAEEAEAALSLVGSLPPGARVIIEVRP